MICAISSKPSLQSFLPLRYTAAMSAKSLTGITTPVNNQKAVSRLNVNAAFFMPDTLCRVKKGLLSLWELNRAEAGNPVEGCHLFGVEKSTGSCGYPSQYPPFSITTDLMGILCIYLTKKVFIMAKLASQVAPSLPEDCFIINPEMDLSNPIEPVWMILTQANALLSLLQADDDTRDALRFPPSVLFNALYLLESQLNQAITLLEVKLFSGVVA